MSKAIFTPGPWTVDNGDSPLIGVFGPDLDPVCYMSGIEVSKQDQRGYDVDLANALLIVAAPDLLEGCRKAVSCASINSDVRNLILAAISKATGARGTALCS